MVPHGSFQQMTGMLGPINLHKKTMSKKLHDITIDAKQLSPVLDTSVKNYLIDIDGTVTDDVPNEDPERMKHMEPFSDALVTCNKWYDEGHIITFFTSRT